MFPYQHHVTSSKISRLLGNYNIETIHVLLKKTISTLQSLKDNLGLKTHSMYCILCECGKAHIGQTDRSMETRGKEFVRHFAWASERGQLWQSTLWTQGRALSSTIFTEWPK